MANDMPVGFNKTPILSMQLLAAAMCAGVSQFLSRAVTLAPYCNNMEAISFKIKNQFDEITNAAEIYIDPQLVSP